jgi:quercetin dioxygenase-like cupin family protein
MRSFLVTLEGEGEAERFSSHRGEKFILVREGAVRAVLAGHEEVLREGDSIYFPSSIPHRIENLDARGSVILAVIYDGRDAS